MKKPALVVAPAHANERSAYVGHEPRDIKALSPQEIDAILAGKGKGKGKGMGMGLAKAAELNEHPGPARVLELADKLDSPPSSEPGFGPSSSAWSPLPGQAHLEQTAVLTATQASAYSKLRGYGTTNSGGHAGHEHRHR